MISHFWRRPVPLRRLLIFVAVIILLPAFLAAGVAVQKVREGERQATLRGLRETVRATSLLVDGEIKLSLGELSTLGNSPYLESGNLLGFYQQAAAINQMPDVWTLLLDEDGRQVLNTVVPFGTPPPPPVAQAQVRKVMATQRPLVSDLFVRPVTGKLLTTIYVPTKAMGGRKYVLAQAFAVDQWKKTALQPQDQFDLIVAVIDSKGRFIARSKKAETLLGKMARPELVAAAAASGDGLIRHKTLEGIDSYDAFTHSKLTGWTVAVAAPVSSIETSATEAVTLLSLGVGTAMALALGAAWFFAHRFIQAVEAATEASRSIERGMVPSVSTTMLQEMNTLNGSLVHAGHVLAAGRRSREALEAERLQLLNNETSARQAAQAENAAKDKFLALLGHELRNPLAAINGATEVLKRVIKDPMKSEKYLGIIQRQNKHLAHIVNDLLDISRMLSGKIVLETKLIDLAECVQICTEAFRASHRASEHRLMVNAQQVWVEGDPTRLDQILNNLLANAVKFSGPDDVIRVVVRPDGEQAIIVVSDVGQGISQDLMPQIFEPFVQGPPPQGQMHTGLGIGLALVKQLVELHGGVITARSGGAGTGSMFVVALPRAPIIADVGPEACHESGSGCHVLLVEDNHDVMAVTSDMLRHLGYAVTEAQDGDQAVLSMKAQIPDIVLLDIGLPGRDGHQVAAELKAIANGRPMALIALTGYGHQPGADAMRGPSRFNEYLIKPVAPDRLQQAIERQFKGVSR